MRRLLLIALTVAAAAAFFVPAAAAGGGTLIVNGNWRCVRAVDYDLVQVTSSGRGDAVQLSTGCTGRIGRLEVTGVLNGDGVKVQNASANAAHDLVIESLLVSCSGRSTDGTHQDGIQVMGGRNLTFRNYVIDCYGGGGGNIFVQRAGGGATTPTNIRFEHGAVGPHFGPNGGPSINVGNAVNVAMVDSLICRQLNGRSNPIVGSLTQSGNTVVAASDPRCANVETLEAWVTGTRPGPQPEPEPEPEPEPGVCDQACVDAFMAEIAQLRAELDAAGVNEAELLGEIARLEGLLAEIQELAEAA